MSPNKNENIQGEIPANHISDRIFEYDDYRSFLRDFFEEQRRLKSFFSHRYFAQKAGFNSHSFCSYIMDGKRNLSFESIRKMVRGVGITGKKAKFFETLVFYNQSKDMKDREDHYFLLQRIRRSTEFFKLHQKHITYYDHWYYPVLRELAIYSDWKGDYRKIGKMLRPSLTADEARKGIENLVDIGLLEKVSAGTYKQNSPLLSAEGIPGFVFKEARRNILLRALEASDHYDKSERHMAYSILATSKDVYNEATKLLDETRKRILVMAMEDEQVDGIWAINMNLFPLSHNIDVALPPKKGDDTK